jgi:RNA polymerase sigma-54 factor
MKLSFGQHLQQKQVQTLAPRMIQSMEILQMPLVELQERIEQELSENPVLEMRADDPLAPREEDPDAAPARDVDEKELVVDEAHNNADDFERLLNLDREIPEHFDERPRMSINRMQEQSDRAHDLMANVADRQDSLQEYLMHQLGEMDVDPPMLRMCERIISALAAENGGYLQSSLADLLPSNADAAQLELAQQALKLVQALDPPGIAARDLKECLLLQLRPEMPFHDEMKVLILNHLEDLRDNRLPHICKSTGYTIEQVNLTWEQLKKLNPKPASSFAEQIVPAVTPELWLEVDENGDYRVKMDEGPSRNLYISQYYLKRIGSGKATPEELEFIRRKVNAAQWLIESIQQRRATLMRVAQAIIDHQRAFLERGPEAIEPLKMQQIADRVGVHVTTVSRAVDDKWIDTPRGIFPLRRFFVGGTQNDSGEDVAWDAIRLKLEEVIGKEDKSHPLSDDEIVKTLKSMGLNVARRTVTKYRIKMGIPSSRQRRDWSKQK